ncbi:GNAT family N-acetyltransferase [Nocardia sp. NPDC051030]|uniref:GNAT family N-acetyltransferase n=1 Tax=Nocardia sp. NPDC051030 TaxID=3155162 RepID=UPI00342D28B8
MSGVIVRPAEVADEKFLWAMLFEAAYSREQGMTSPDELRAVPELARYVEGWGVAGDLGVIAEEDGVLLGAAWARMFTRENAAYGYVDDATPEIAIAVAPEGRGAGLGTQLMTGLLDAMRPVYDSVSLSVRRENPALRLYERLGFVEVPDTDHGNRAGTVSVTMVLRFR